MASYVLLSLAWVCASASSSEWIDVHVVPHSHMDAGWLYNVDQYYESGVMHILSSVTERLRKHPEATYTHGDIYYFQRWYTN